MTLTSRDRLALLLGAALVALALGRLDERGPQGPLFVERECRVEVEAPGAVLVYTQSGR